MFPWYLHHEIQMTKYDGFFRCCDNYTHFFESFANAHGWANFKDSLDVQKIKIKIKEEAFHCCRRKELGPEVPLGKQRVRNSFAFFVCLCGETVKLRQRSAAREKTGSRKRVSFLFPFFSGRRSFKSWQRIWEALLAAHISFGWGRL